MAAAISHKRDHAALKVRAAVCSQGLEQADMSEMKREKEKRAGRTKSAHGSQNTDGARWPEPAKAPGGKRKKKKNPLPGRILGVILIVAAALCLVFLARTFLESRTDTGASAAAGGDGNNSSGITAAGAEGDASQTEGTGAQNEADAKMLDLTAEQIHRGDLILVNGTYPYDFEANRDTALANIRGQQSYYYQVDNTDFSVAASILPYLDQMVAACDAAMGTSETGITSAYRSYNYQQNVWDTMAEQYGQKYAESYVAVPGYSEHHTGLAVDVGIFYADGSQGSFSESANAVWMNEHSSEFGFVRRYAEDKVSITGISNEAWHFRFVGVPHAVFMKKKNLCLEEYLDFLHNKTNADEPLAISTDEGNWSVWYTADARIPMPDGEYTVSGDNSSGYIITVRK